MNELHAKNFLFWLVLLLSPTALTDQHNEDFFLTAESKVAEAVNMETAWTGPLTGPSMSSQKEVIFIASDLRNGGVYGVAEGLSEAMTYNNWSLQYIDGKGSEVSQSAGLKKAVSFLPDAIILGGIDAQYHRDILLQAQQLGIIIVGWHATDFAGANPDLGLFVNVTTNPLDVAKTSALLAIVNAKGQANVLVFSDPNYKIATLKAESIVNTLQQCDQCNVVGIENLPLDEIANKMPATLERVWAEYDQDITHFIAINDLYFDFAVPSLESRIEAGHVVPETISAGDGSAAAYQRIHQGRFQMATVPEPLYLHGWQIVDELNRAFNRMPPSGFSSPVQLVTQDNVDELTSQNTTDVYDPENGYRDAYLRIWGEQQ